MEKPTLKREVAIQNILRGVNMITFYATDDAVTEFESFGAISPKNTLGLYELWVDSRVDFEEVVEFIEDYG